MIFKQHQQVLDGEKTQTRRLVKDGDASLHEAPGYAELPIKSVYAGGIFTGRLRWRINKTYAVQPGRGKKAVGRIRITEIRRERVQDISRIDAQAEGILCPNCQGYHSRSCNCIYLFGKLWDSIYTGTEFEFAANPEVWVLTFEVVDGQT